MRALLQRVNEASVTVDGETVGTIGRGYLVFLGIAEGDGDEDLDYIVGKLAAIRLFADEDGKMNLDLKQAMGAFLLVSQFTLLADTRKGNRPSFTGAAQPGMAMAYFERAAGALRKLGFPVETGVFGADMKVALVNEGPVTIWLDSRAR